MHASKVWRRRLPRLVRDGAPRTAQLQALARLDALMRLPDGDTPSARAARLVLQTIALGARAKAFSTVIASGAKPSKGRGV